MSEYTDQIRPHCFTPRWHVCDPKTNLSDAVSIEYSNQIWFKLAAKSRRIIDTEADSIESHGGSSNDLGNNVVLVVFVTNFDVSNKLVRIFNLQIKFVKFI